ncbi:MAG: NCS2 family permease, partial [Firmicutes bacterium]|nr:NCS2 family permease [Bacillota bacterium]
IPPAATSSALIYVGILMLSNLKHIDWNDISQALPVAIMLLAMPVSGSIGHGIGLALISYTVIKLCMGKSKDVSVLTYILSLIFIIKFFLPL